VFGWMNKDGLHSLAFVWLVVQIWYRDLASENGEVTISRFSSSQSSFFSSCAVDGGPNQTPARSMAGQIEPPRRRWWHRPTRYGHWGLVRGSGMAGVGCSAVKEIEFVEIVD